ncbi:hypothetical protein ONS95_006400 [Cadophora gregata]|uniref:uncharacterized protein n=1 Tax=Cadophora gregata TaxID=51156 RepID=UPI0026DBE19D|nr:uncharacterized protein ONS95_006400 [Cadophora gregata]KAK0102803.1 hypothetical protein ONS95_006400 [Cadophora gregata]
MTGLVLYNLTRSLQEVSLQTSSSVIQTTLQVKSNITMQLSHLSAVLLLPLLTSSTPLGNDQPSFFYKQLSLTFHGGPASYSLTFPADGNTYPTNSNALTINRITTNSDFNIFYGCNFYFADDGGKPVATSSSGADGREVLVGTPRVVTGVNCQPTPGGSNTCLPVYASCEWCGGANGEGGCHVLNCCSGYCAATKCRSTS